MHQLKVILSLIEGNANFDEKDISIENLLPLDSTSHSKKSISWCSDANFNSDLNNHVGILIISQKAFDEHKSWILKSDLKSISVSKPRNAFKLIVDKLFSSSKIKTGISSSAIIASSVNIPSTCFIGHHVVIEDGVQIGENTFIDHNTVIKENTIIQSSVRIGCNTTIGNFGFGYQPNEQGVYEHIEHIGNVIIEDNTEIGNNVTIDKAVLGSTIIGTNVKIDNLVHIAHGVKIGRNSLIIANAMIAGSVNIGENCWIAPSSSIIQKKNIGNNSIIGLGSVVIRDVADGDTVAGVPAKSLKK
jgi:UDP-3-O-[3-hydroxymyristoyl] glucosamine N-acyltransferase